ncbi:MAG: GAF domain-containing protein [Gammaproteobacteria bacterium]|nr:GAF domain-containing protein [Gammaproteobacteria bacterium]
MIDHVDHFVLTTRDPERCVDFYTRVLGMRRESFGDGRTAFRFGDQKINLHVAGREFEPKADRPTPGSLDLCFIASVPLSEVVRRLNDAGVSSSKDRPVRRGPRPKPHSKLLEPLHDRLELRPGVPVRVGPDGHRAPVVDLLKRSEAALLGKPMWLDLNRYSAVALSNLGAKYAEARDAVTKVNARRERLQSVLETVAAGAVQERFAAAGMAIANELATRLRCDRVSIGLNHGRRLRIDAVSHSAQFKERTNLMRAVAAAMEEAIDQGTTVAYPPVGRATPAVARAHELLIQSHGTGACVSIPLTGGRQGIGAITLERPAQRPFDAETIEIGEAVAGLAGPMLNTHRREDQWLVARAFEKAGDTMRKVFGPRHAGLKLAAIVLALLIAFMAIGKGSFRVAGTTTLEPLVQQAAVAPFDGYIREAPARAGDVVKQGAVLARLDDRELRLERLKWMAQQEEYSKQFRQAMADRNPAQVQIVTAQLEQARAQAARIADQLERTTVSAPFDGIVVSGDLTQQLVRLSRRGKCFSKWRRSTRIAWSSRWTNATSRMSNRVSRVRCCSGPFRSSRLA